MTAPTDDMLAAQMTAAGLGPVASVRTDSTATFVTLPDTPAKVATLRRWVATGAPCDMTAGRYHAADVVLWLNLRVAVTGRTTVVVSAPFDAQEQRHLVLAIEGFVDRLDPAGLLNLLDQVQS